MKTYAIIVIHERNVKAADTGVDPEPVTRRLIFGLFFRVKPQKLSMNEAPNIAKTVV